jgi:uncharacterized integral membrane protein (TIGR00697 family)
LVLLVYTVLSEPNPGAKVASRETELHPIEASRLHARREIVFLVVSGLFLGSLTMLNVLGLTRFIDLSFTVFGFTVPMPLAVGVLPYPVTFLCTDIISEIYGRRRAANVVWMGLALNMWVMFVLWLGGALPGAEGSDGTVFFAVQKLAFGAVVASMVAYLFAQMCDVHLFHFWKRLTKGKHLWLRNNASTMVSQLIDSVAVMLVTHYYAQGLPIDASEPLVDQLMTFIVASYVFKVVCAALDTLPFYVLVRWLNRYLQISDPISR